MKVSVLGVVSVLSGVAVAAACSSSSNKGGEGPGDGGGSGEGGAVTDGASGEGSSSGATTLPYVGTLTAEKTAGSVYVISGAFIATPDGGGGGGNAATCAAPSTMSGSCCYTPPIAADAGTTPSDAGAQITAVSAGAIIFKDGTTNLASISPGTGGAYDVTSANNVTVKWTAGDSLSVSAAGATVQSFTGSLTTAQDLAGVTPALSLTAAATIPLNADFAVKWTAGNATTVRVSLVAKKGGSIICPVDDSTGTVTVPSALLSKLTTGDTGLLTLTRETIGKATAANANVNLVGSATASGAVKLQ